jgi:GT2 family glycosyltransferase
VRDDRAFNFSAINNLGVRESRGALIGLINNDIEVINPEWLTEMVRLATQSDIGCVGAKLYYPSHKIQHAGVVLGILGVAGHSHKFASRHADGYFGRLKLPQAMSAVTAACLLVRREVYDEVH